MLRKWMLVAIYILFAVILFACYDSREVDEFAYVVAMGIDKGEGQAWKLTIQIPTMEKSAGTSGEDGSSEGEGQHGEYEVASVDAPSFFAAVQMLNASVPRKLNFFHTKMIAISEELAKSGEIGEMIAPIVRTRQIRRIAHIVVCKGSAEEFIKENKPVIGKNLSKTMELAFNEFEETGFFPHSTLYDFYLYMKSYGYQPVAMLGSVNKHHGKEDLKDRTEGDYTAGQLPKKGGREIEFFGSAIFDGAKMITELTGDETRVMLMARGEFKRGCFTIPDPKRPELIIPIEVYMTDKPERKINLEGESPEIDLTVKLEGDILAIQSRLEYEKGELKKELENACAQYIQEELDRTIQKCRNLGVDVFRFADTAIWQFPTIQDWEDYAWDKRFKNAKINTKVEFRIRRTGRQFRSSPIITSEGSE